MRAFLLLFTLAIPAATPAFAQKSGGLKPPAPKTGAPVDRVAPLVAQADQLLAAGKTAEARASYVQVLQADPNETHPEASKALARLILDERLAAGDTYPLPREQLIQRFDTVPFLARGYAEHHLGKPDEARRAWHKIIEWRDSNQLVQVLHELSLDSEIDPLHQEMGIDSGRGSGPQAELEAKYRSQGDWAGAFETARRRAQGIPVAAEGDFAAIRHDVLRGAVEALGKENDPDAGLRVFAADALRRTKAEADEIRAFLQGPDAAKLTPPARKIWENRLQALSTAADRMGPLAQAPALPSATAASPVPPPSPE